MNIISPFNQRQTLYLDKCTGSWFNVAEGGKRGSKNVLQTMAFCIALENHPNRLHLISGVSVSTARLNVLDCDGYGLLNYFGGRCRSGEYQKRDCLYIKTHSGEKVVLISGGGKNGDEKLIKGNSYGMAYITEANECTSIFLKEVFDRTIASKNRKIFHDLNPKSEGHWYYDDILEFHEQKQLDNPRYGYNYGHFTIADNSSISDKQLKGIIDTYDKNTVWYMRDILGKRKQTEGLIYPMFNREFCVKPTIPRPYEKYYISNDFGVNHPLVYHLFGLYNGTWYMIKEFYYDGQKNGQKTAEEYYDELIKLVGDLNIRQFIKDNAPVASAFNVLIMRKGNFRTRLADNEVAQGIQDVATVLKNGTLKINDCCTNTIREFGLYSWNAKSTEDEPIKENDDCMDCLRYFVRTMRIAAPKQKSLRESLKNR